MLTGKGHWGFLLLIISISSQSFALETIQEKQEKQENKDASIALIDTGTKVAKKKKLKEAHFTQVKPCDLVAIKQTLLQSKLPGLVMIGTKGALDVLIIICAINQWQGIENLETTLTTSSCGTDLVCFTNIENLK